MKKKIILNDNQLDTTLDRLACQLTENHQDFKETILVGLQPRGKSLCKKLVTILVDKYNIKSVNHGFLDITFFRDDFRRNKDILLPNRTDFKLLVENKKVVLKYKTYLQDKKVTLNQYQTLPKNIYYVNTYIEDTPEDSWNYYLVEVLNPDEAISSFFMSIKNLPSITCIDKDLNFKLHLKFTDKDWYDTLMGMYDYFKI